MGKQLDELWEYAQRIAGEEDRLPDPPDFTQFNKEKVEATVEQLNKALAGKAPVDKKVKAKLRYVTQQFPQSIAIYEKQEQILLERNSYSETDPDATFMRMKEDHMKNGQLKPAYNLQISTSNQFIVNYSLYPNPTDTTTMATHLEKHIESFGDCPKVLVADVGYGSQENFQSLEVHAITAYVKYNYFDKEQDTNFNNKHPFSPDKLYYNEQKDCYICPIGQEMAYIGTGKQITGNGFEQHIRKYRAQDCSHCPLNGKCHKSKGSRIISINRNLNRQKAKTKELLNTQEGIRLRKKRCYDVEPVFGNIKQNHGFRRFMLRGKKKLEIEWGLLAIAQNLRKKAS